ncbi:MAG: M4 family metallopeptidase [Anaerolineae bacterium]
MKINNKAKKTAILSVMFISMLVWAARHAPQAQAELASQTNSPAFLINQLTQETQGNLRISTHEETGQVRFIAATGQRPLAPPPIQSLGLGNKPETAARRFLTQYGRLFGLQDPNRELAVMKEWALKDGRAFVRYQQQYRGVPVIGGELIVQLSPDQAVMSANGEVLPGLNLSVIPAVTAAAARQNALEVVSRDYGVDVAGLSVSQPALWIYDPAILGGPGPRFSSLVWRMEVTAGEQDPIRVLVLVDAQLGAVVLQFNQIDSALDRTIYDNNNDHNAGLPGIGPVRTEGDAAISIADVDNAYDFSGDTYNFYWTEHGRDSLDDAGMTLISTVRYCKSALSCPYANAFWNGTQMVYGEGYASADDVVGHELTHGVTELTSNLFYFYQTGAINESFSDVWGEFIDLTNTAGSDGPTDRWLVGEDLPGGAIRSMKDPTSLGDPDKMSSPNYYCQQSSLESGSGDNGGVHTNSGINNKAAYLMVDGGTFNGKTVAALGISKVADLYYYAQTNLLTSAADYADLYDALQLAAANLGFTTPEQQAVLDALDAVEMGTQPTTCAVPEAPICESGTPTDLFFDDIESGAGNWVTGIISATNQFWFVPQTSSTIGLADPYATSGTGNIWGFDQGGAIGGISDTYLAMKTDVVSLPSNAYMHFNHSYGFDSSTPSGLIKYDGGIVEYSLNGGTTWQDAGALFTHNGYDGTLIGTNPLGAISAFTADSRGYISSRLDLNSLAGSNVRFRFRIGTGLLTYDYGWFIDDVRIYTCGTSTNTNPTLTGLPDQTVPENGSVNTAIDLWAYASDAENADPSLSFSIINTPVISAGVSISGNRYIAINPAVGWTGTTSVTVQVQDTGGLVDSDSFNVTVGTHKVFLPTIMNNVCGNQATPGFWQSLTGDEFYVSTDHCSVVNFAVHISVQGCGNYKITHTTQEPISGDQFSFTGSFYGSGTFSSATAASGTDGLNSLKITGCGLVSGGPWSWNATWQDSSQPAFLPAEVVGPASSEPAHYERITITPITGNE